MATHKAIGGEVSTPYGSTFKVTGGNVRRRRLAVDSITSPSSNGNPEFSGGNFVHEFSLQGYYAEGSTRFGEGEDGSATIKLGTGAQWSGQIVVNDEAVAPNWEGGGSISMNMSGRFTGQVTKSNG